MGAILVIMGIAMTLMGALLMLLSRIGFRGLPGDILFRQGNVTIFVPIISSIVLSIVLSLVLNFFARK